MSAHYVKRGNRVIVPALLMLALFLYCDADARTVNDIHAYTLSAHSLARSYTITATAGPGGSISPSGKIRVNSFGSKTFYITADEGYNILDVRVDGESQGPITTYEFVWVRSDHIIEALFTAKTYMITPVSGPNGSISPSEPTIVKHGADQEFIITPDPGYKIEDVQVDEASVGAVSSFTFTHVTDDHSIAASFLSSVAVTGLTFENKSMKIGDVVPVTITVKNDSGLLYSLVSGSVGGYLLEDFKRISATACSASFMIIQGGNSYSASEDIPVSNLVISYGADLSPPYNDPVVQDNDPLDADLPVISSIQAGGGTRKIGDVIYMIIEADGSEYSLDARSTINGITATEPNMTFSESGGGLYMLSYRVREGDTDVGPDDSEFSVSVMLKKPSGNTGMPYTSVTTTSPLYIDAHAPVVSRLEVPNLEVGVGGTVTIQVTADGTGYKGGTGTVVNGVTMNSYRVILKERSDGIYELSYVVAVGDADAAPGELSASITMIDEAGNTGNPYSILQPNNLEVYTELPEVTLYGTPEICEGEEGKLRLFFTGRSPWNFDLYDGETVVSYTNIPESNQEITVNPVQNTTYQITSVTDINGVENNNTAEYQIEVLEKTDVEIINLATGYNVEADPVKLEANVPGGIFSGPGVNIETGYFYPSVADTLNSPHTIYYHYENAQGCISIASRLVYVTGSTGTILIPESIVCANGNPFTATAFNVPGEIGSFSLLNSSAQPVRGLVDHLDGTATIVPDSLGSGDYTIEYRYFNNITLSLRKSFSVVYVIKPQILNLKDSPYCQNSPPFELLANVSNVVFEGPGVSWNMNDGYMFNPAEIDPGTYSIVCTAASNEGCSASSSKHVEILFSPEVKFEMSSECMPEGGEKASFYNQTSGNSSVETWSWNFGDPGSGENNQSTLPNPTHFYMDPGQKTINLTATTFEGCTATYEMETIINSMPVADFSWISDCYATGSDVRFIDRTFQGSASVDTIIWTFRTGNGDVLGKIGSVLPADTVGFLFDKVDTYRVDLYVQNRGGCSSELSKEIVLRPTVQMDREGYMESFDETDGLWTVHSENEVESWVWGEPDFTGYIPSEGNKAWFTQLPSGETGYREDSWIQSPCYDFKDLDQPMIQMDMMRSFYPYLSGAVLQYQDGMEEGWKILGENRPGYNWYNFDFIINEPGGSPVGWGSEELDPDTEWVTAVHDLDDLAGKSNVSLRIAFTSIGWQQKGNQGLAVNNIFIRERSRIAVLEHFTNYASSDAYQADEIIDHFSKKHPRDLIDLQYHMPYPESDPMNDNNPVPPSTRSLVIGVPEIPYTILNGGVYPDHRYGISELANNALEDQLLLLTLEIPAFDIDLSVDWFDSSLTANITVTCQADQFDGFVDLYQVVFETAVTSYMGRNGETLFRNVVLDMLPIDRPTILLGERWRKGNSKTNTDSWDYKSYVEDVNELALVAFVQERSTGRILQAAVDYRDKTVGIPDLASGLRTIKIYPNPTQGIVYVDPGEIIEHPGRIELKDMNGRTVFSEYISAGSQIIQLNTDHLEPGIYILQWLESEQIRGVNKIVRTR